MEKDGLVKKHRGSGKRNNTYITLTEKGQEAFSHSQKRESIKEILSCLSEEERLQLDSSLEKLHVAAIKSLTAFSEVPFP